MNVLVLGHKHHGKTTVARMLQRYELSFVDTSDLLIDLAIKLNIEEHRPEKYITGRDQVYRDKELYRDWLVHSLAVYNEQNNFCEYVLDKCNIYCGMRSAEEYEANKHRFDRIVWVEVPDGPVDHTMQIEFDPACMTKLYNNGTKIQLAKQVKAMVCQWANMSMTAYDDTYGSMYDRFITNAVSVEPKSRKLTKITLEGLKLIGFSLAIKNNGGHIIAVRDGKRYDYWPSTGRVHYTASTGIVKLTEREWLAQL